MTDRAKSLYDALIVELHEEFPRFRIIDKSDSRFQKIINVALLTITLGRMRTYLTDYQTTIGYKLYVTDAWHGESYESRYSTLRHERIHLRQFRRYTFVGMSLLYLLFPLPMGLAWWRAKFERDAYAEGMRADAELYGVEYVQEEGYRRYVVRQFTSASYGWMWPFKKSVNRWFDRVLETLETPA